MTSSATQRAERSLEEPEITRVEIIAEQSRKVMHGQRLMLERIESVPHMRVTRDVPRESLCYVAWRCPSDDDIYWRLCKVVDFPLHGVDIELCDTGEIRRSVDFNAVRLLITRVQGTTSGKVCQRCGGPLLGKGRAKYCKISCRAAAERSRRKAVK